jgi:predicted lipoprotein with Yx(FWY)xxD motif
MNARLILLAGTVLLLAACGSSKSSSGGSTTPSGGGGVTVAARNVSGAGTVLVDAQGNALYSPVEEQGGKVLCTDGCTAIWVPLTLQAGASKPMAAPGLAGRLGVVERPNGIKQIAWNGRPLYTFVEDGGPGTVTGNGTMDSFGGTSFTWHVATAGKQAATTTPMTTEPMTTTSGRYGY